MVVRKLMDLVSGKVNFKILRSLHDKPLYAGDLAQRLSANVLTIRVHLHRLRNHNFVDYKKTGRKHLYHIKTPFESTEHELLMTLITLAEPIKKRGEDNQPLDVSESDFEGQKTQKNYWTTLIKGVYKVLVHQGSIAEQKKLRAELNEISNRVDNLDID